MAHMKTPIVGDRVRGALKLPQGASPELIEALRGFKRQALHAEILEFTHPGSGQPLRCTAPVPADMQRLLDALRADSKAYAANGRS